MCNFSPLSEDGCISPFVKILPANERGLIYPFIQEGDEEIPPIYDDEVDKLAEICRETLRQYGFSDEKIDWIYQNAQTANQPPKEQKPSSASAPAPELPADTAACIESKMLPAAQNKPVQIPDNAKTQQGALPMRISPTGHSGVVCQMPRSSRNPTPLEAAEQFKAKLPMFVLAEELYVYAESCYVKQCQPDAERLIRLYCAEACAAAGRPEFAVSVYKCLLQDPRLLITEKDLANHYVAFNDYRLLNLRTGEIQEATPNIRSTYALNCPTPAPEYQCPCFDRVMANIVRGDPILLTRFMEVLGYLVSGDTRGKCIFLFQGVSNSGKSLLVKLLLHCFAQEQRLTMDLRAMGERFALSNLQGVRINVCHDMSAEVLSTEVVRFIKTITGDEELTSDQKYKRAVHFTHHTRLVMVTNYAVLSRHTEEAALLEARTVTLPFAYSVPKEQWDHELADRLIKELPAILYRAFQAYYTLVRNKYIFSGSYPMNAVVNPVSANTCDSLEAKIADFVLHHVAQESNAVLHLDDALEQFCALYCTTVTTAKFSARFKQLAVKHHGAVATKARREGIGNPISSLRHVKLVE